MIHDSALMALMALTHIFCLAVMTERKYSIKITLLAYGLFFAFFVGWTQLVSAWLGPMSPYAIPNMFSITILAAFLLFLLTSSDAFCKKLFLFISYSNLFCIFCCFAAIINDALFSSLTEEGAQYVRSIIRTFLYIPAVLVYLKYFRPYIRMVPAKKKRTWYSISLVSMLLLVIFASCVVRIQPHATYTGQSILLFIILVLIYFSVLWIIFGTIQHMNYEAKTELIGKNIEYLQGQLAIAEENEMAAKTIRHDFRHHNQNIAALLQKGEVQEALSYVKQYDASLDAGKPKEFCPHATVNAILSSFYSRAQKDGVLVSMSADTPKASFIDDIDYVAILSNLLENALNGCKECGSPGEIRMDIRAVADKLVIVCSNPCKPGLVLENGIPKQRGTGIDSVILAVRKYNGDIRYELEGETLLVCVILNPSQGKCTKSRPGSQVMLRPLA